MSLKLVSPVMLAGLVNQLILVRLVSTVVPLRLASPVTTVRLVKQAISGKLVSPVVSVKQISPFMPFTLVSPCQVRRVRPVRLVASLVTSVRMTKSRWEVRHVSNINQVAQFCQVTQPLRLVGSALSVEFFWSSTDEQISYQAILSGACRLPLDQVD